MSKKSPSAVPCLPPARTRPSRPAEHSRPHAGRTSWRCRGTRLMEFEPPLVGCVDQPTQLHLRHPRATKECVITSRPWNWPSRSLVAGTLLGSGWTSSRRSADAGGCIASQGTTHQGMLREPRVQSCRHEAGRRLHFFVLEVVKAWIARSRRRPRTMHHGGKGIFMVRQQDDQAALEEE